MIIGVLHPGQMGIFVAATLKRSGHEVLWLSEGRSPSSRDRAEEHSLREISSLSEFCQQAELIVSVCPPHGAEELAQSVLDEHFQGAFIDCNPLTPRRVELLGESFNSRQIPFTDGGIIGNPDWENETTMLYLSGPAAEQQTSLFKEGPLQVTSLDDKIGRASALKLSYAAYTKGGTALISAILALAESHGVREVLEKQWASDWPGFEAQAQRRARGVTRKAWRFAGEMEIISEAFRDAGLPGDFHAAAAKLYHRIAHLKDRAELPELLEVLNDILEKNDG